MVANEEAQGAQIGRRHDAVSPTQVIDEGQCLNELAIPVTVLFD